MQDSQDQKDSLKKNPCESMICCNFCGKTQGQVKVILAGPRVYICNECVELCHDIVSEYYEETKAKQTAELLESKPENNTAD